MGDLWMYGEGFGRNYLTSSSFGSLDDPRVKNYMEEFMVLQERGMHTADERHTHWL